MEYMAYKSTFNRTHFRLVREVWALNVLRLQHWASDY